MKTAKNTVFTASFLLSAFALVGYILGFLRGVIIAAIFGASRETDAYFIAISIPDFIHYVLNTPFYFAIVSLYNEYKETGGSNKESLRVVSAMVGVLLVISLAITIGVILFAPNIIRGLAPGFDANNTVLAVKLARIISASIIFLTISNLFSGVLNAERHFALPALRGPIQNIFIVSFIVFFASKIGISSAVLGNVFGMVLIFLLLSVGMVRWINYKGTIAFKHAGIVKGFKFALPLMLGAGVTKANVIVDRLMASRLTAGSISALSYGYLPVNFAHTIFAVSIATVIHSSMSAVAAKSDMRELQQTIQQGLRFVFLIIVPASIGLIILNKPIIEVLFQRGAFDGHDASIASRILCYYSIGLFAISLSSILNRALFSIQNTKIYAIVGIFAFILNIILNLLLLRLMGLAGIALSTSIVYITVFLILLFAAQRQISFNLMQDVGYYWKVIVSSLVMAFVVLLSFYLSGKLFSSSESLFKIFQLVIAIGCGVGVFLATAIVFKIREIHQIFQILKHKRNKL